MLGSYEIWFENNDCPGVVHKIVIEWENMQENASILEGTTTINNKNKIF